MNLLLEARSILDAAGYRTLGSDSTDATLYFEDESILGMIHQYADSALLVSEWEKMQDEFLRKFAGQFRSHPDKAWNIYTVHLTAGAASPQHASDLFEIEEDFRGTRKLARASVNDKEALRVALLPLIPIQGRVALTRTSLSEQLKDRLAACNPSLVELLTDLPVNEIVVRIMEAGK